MKLMILAALFAAVTVGQQANAQNTGATLPRLEYTGYFRTGTGSNLHGGAMECTASGMAGNEFRFGNECGLYAELGFALHHLESQNADGPYFKTKSLFSYYRPNFSDDEGILPGGDGAGSTSLSIRELYAEGGNLSGTTLSFWAGKRFYRWPDSHIQDFFPVAFNGAGGGFGNISLLGGKLQFAYIQSATNEINTSVGSPAKSSISARLEYVPVGVGLLDAWVAYGWTGAGADEADPTTPPTPAAAEAVRAANGYLAALEHRLAFDDMSNTLGLGWGAGNLSDFTMSTPAICDTTALGGANCNAKDSSRIRAWDNFLWKMGALETVVALNYDVLDNGADANSKSDWLSLGVSPVYSFNDNFQLAGVIGQSMSTNDGVANGDSQNLFRVTVGPQVSLQKGVYGRPVIRLFYTYSAWNEAARDQQVASSKATSRTDDLSSNAIGMQAEAWF